MMTPRAVPLPVVAKGPVLQWVRIVSPSLIRAAPFSAIFRVASISSPLDGHEQVAGGGAGGGDLGSDRSIFAAELLKVVFLDLQRAEGDAIGRGDADGGGAADFEAPDGLGHLVVVGQFEVDLMLRQARLVDDHQAVAKPLDRFDLSHRSPSLR